MAREPFILGFVDMLGTQFAVSRDLEIARSRVSRFTELCAEWARDGSSTHPDDAQLFSDSLVLRWEHTATPLTPLLELATLFVFVSWDNLKSPENPLWIRGALVSGEERFVRFGRTTATSEETPQKVLRDYALSGLKVALAEKTGPGNRFFIGQELIRGRPELEEHAVRYLCVLPWPLPEAPVVDVLWSNAAPSEDLGGGLLPYWLRTCHDLQQNRPAAPETDHAWSTLAMLTHAVFQRNHFRTDSPVHGIESRVLRFLVWAAKCGEDLTYASARRFLDICRSLPPKLVQGVSDLFDIEPRDLSGDIVSSEWRYARRYLGDKIPWETRGYET